MLAAAALLTPNSTRGEGWRLLGVHPGGEPNRALAVIDAASLAALADELQVGEFLRADLAEEVVLAFTVVTSSGLLGCEPVGFRGLLADGDAVMGSFRRAELRLGCNDDALLTTFVVALDRDLVPADGFVLKLSAEAPAVRVEL